MTRPHTRATGTRIRAAHTALAIGAHDKRQVSGWTHGFYRYPARFSPQFVRAALKQFSKPGDTVADPYMGGGTTVVECLAHGRHVIGNDLNELAVFVARVKTTPISPAIAAAVTEWANDIVPFLSYRIPSEWVAQHIDTAKTKNLQLPRARFIKKVVAAALAFIDELPCGTSRDLAKCVVLRTAQWALDGRRLHTSLEDFRSRLSSNALQMVESMAAFSARTLKAGGSCRLYNMDATLLSGLDEFQREADRVSLVITSPPYPGVHVLYHRWQVDGRRETPAPYWIAGCEDGKGASYYNFGDRRETAADKYFASSHRTLRSIRNIMRDGAYFIQMVAFNRPEEQLPRYLQNMAETGFAEVSANGDGRIWRRVPNRKWHAALRGMTSSANEVVFVHRAV